jgi:Protein of unknown function (DUF3311)
MTAPFSGRPAKLEKAKPARATHMFKHHLWLLLLPYIGLLWVPFYNHHDPVLFGFPFFYWYQLAWVPVTAFLTWIAYRTYPDEE